MASENWRHAEVFVQASVVTRTHLTSDLKSKDSKIEHREKVRFDAPCIQPAGPGPGHCANLNTRRRGNGRFNTFRHRYSSIT